MPKLYTYTCVDCDWTMEHTRPQRGIRCKTCSSRYTAAKRTDPSKTTCPKCGDKKSYHAKTCKSCIDMRGESNPMFGKKNPRSAEANALRSGENHWNYKGGISVGRSAKQIAWAKKVKDGNNCDCCGYSNPMALDAHHLTSHDLDEELRYEVSNGVTLCKNCHTVFHKTYGYGGNTPEQYLTFKEGFSYG